MICITPIVDRHQYFWKGISVETVKMYKDDLEKKRDSIKESGWRIQEISNSYISTVVNTIEKEIKYCEFYLDHFEKMKEPDFDKWIFTKENDRTDVSDWQKAQRGDCWARSNGKIHVTIDVKDTLKTTRISLHITNDNSILDFTSDTYDNELEYRNLRNEESIKSYITYLEKKSERLLEEHCFPYYNRNSNNYNVFCTLMHVKKEE